MREIEYNREKAVAYAKKWAFARNPKYYNFDPVGGDCTNFISQCIYEGCSTMNYTKNTGWYYINGNNKSPSWSGVEFLYNFLTKNKSVGPYGKTEVIENLQIGDILQLSFDGKKFSHTLIVVAIDNKNNLSGIKIASHTFDSFDKAITEYEFKKVRMIHIEGARTY